ncbi:N-acetyltransferase [Candidatus Parcubacteria bacterium]|nr:MAG: N-acetyltransferase [Candidatus Parcubacteria bacterium]
MICQKILKGKKANLRPLKISDAHRWVNWLNDREVNQFLEITRIDLKGEKKAILGMLKDKNNYQFAIETKDGIHIGGCGLKDIIRNGRCELGIVIGDKNYWSAGYGTDVIGLLLKFGFERLNLKRIYLRCNKYNKRGIRCYKKCGFKHEGRLRKHIYRKGKFWDEIRMSILINEYNKKYGKRK